MQLEVELDGLPAPGEPLKQAVDKDNQALLENRVQENIARQKSRLTRRQYRQLSRRLKQLHKQLNRAGYNPLVLRRWRCWQEYQQLIHQMKTAPNKKAWGRLQRVKKAGRAFSQQVKELQPLASEFDDITAKLKAHDELIAWEKEEKENFEAFQREARTWEAQLEAGFYQSPRLHHVSTDNKGNRLVRIPRIRKIIIKDDRVLYLIDTASQTFIEKLYGRWHSTLPYGVDINALMCDDTLANLSAFCNRIVTVERSRRGTNLYYVISRLDSPDGIPQKVSYEKVIDWYPTEHHAKTPWAAGVTKDRKVEWFNFEDNPHVLIAGATQGGKSNHINQMIATLTTMNTPDEVRLLLVDLKGGVEFTHWRGLQHQLKNMLTTPNAVLEGLQWLRSIMERRLEAFESIKAKNLTSYNQKAAVKLPRIVCLVDEMATLIGLGDLTKELHNELRTLSSQGRAVGINLVLCTQHSSVDVLPGWVKTNMGLRISAKMPTHQASMVILDSISAANLPNVPGRMVFSSGRYEIIAQSPFISDDHVERAKRLANQFPKPDDTEFEAEIEPPKPQVGEEDVLHVALEHCDGILSATRIHEVVGKEVITRRKLQQFIDEIIEKLGEGYDLDGTHYTLKKVRNYYQLQSTVEDVEKVANQPANQNIA